MQAVYEGNLIHREPGDATNLSSTEQLFPACADWVATELPQRPHANATSSQAVAESPQLSHAQTQGNSFTRVVVADLRPEVLQQISDSEQYETVCRDLAHLYHYYLHGERGNILVSQEAVQQQGSLSGTINPEKIPKPATLSSGQQLPDIVIEHIVEGQPTWYANLTEVDDDPESLYLRAQQAQLLFTLTVPDRGVVSGVLWYFPFQNDAETKPLLAHPMMFNPGQNATQLTQAGAAQLTQMTQFPVAQVAFAGDKAPYLL